MFLFQSKKDYTFLDLNVVEFSSKRTFGEKHEFQEKLPKNKPYLNYDQWIGMKYT